MAITKKSSKPAAKAAPATVAEPITVTMVRLYGDDGSRNEDSSETLEVVQFPEGVAVAKVAVMLGTAADYGAVKASVTVSVPTTLEEIDAAHAFAYGKAQEYLDAITEDTGDSEAAEAEEEVEEPKSTKKAAAKGKAKKPAAEEEPEEADEDDADAEDDDDGEGLGPDDIDAMDRKQLIAFIEEFKEDDDYDAELDEIDPDDFKKNKTGLAELQEAVKEALFSEDGDEDGEDDADGEGDDDEEGDDLYDEDELADMDLKELKAIWKEWEIGKLPNHKTEKGLHALMVKGILKHQEENSEEAE